jgi:Na+-transporting NADH:ubiquinone oxidoreductase subunit NqrC
MAKARQAAKKAVEGIAYYNKVGAPGIGKKSANAVIRSSYEPKPASKPAVKMAPRGRGRGGKRT